jgi:hypothetical protein
MSLFLKAILGDDVELKDSDIPTAHPLSEFLCRFEHDQVRKGLPGVEDADWNDSLIEKAEKPFKNPLGFDKSSRGYQLRIDRIEQKVINDEIWEHAYSGSELVEAREIKSGI